MDIYITFRDTRRAKLVGVTGTPTEVDVTIQNGYYRDIFTLAVDATFANRNKDIYFPGTEEVVPKTVSLQTPAFVAGAGIVPSGDVVIERLENDTTSKIAVSQFKVAVSDDVAHEPLRQISYIESYWAFPVNWDGESMQCYFRKAVVDGWSNAEISE